MCFSFDLVSEEEPLNASQQEVAVILDYRNTKTQFARVVRLFSGVWGGCLAAAGFAQKEAARCRLHLTAVFYSLFATAFADT
jgi:hypothetical protein